MIFIWTNLKAELSSRPVKIGRSPLLGHIRSNLSKIWTAISFCWLGFDRWVMVRPSGTQSVLRVYAQGDSIK
ncbi:MAG: hypothetical protein IPP42_02790 [Saprospiraceae bacterium]|nr:hypothetical protein [Saprospiraceae bacterium]